MPTYDKFKLGDVQSLDLGPTGPSALSYGFGITNQHGSPLVTIAYRRAAEAQSAQRAIMDALSTAIAVTT